MDPYLYFEGLQRLVKDVSGEETIHIGIRPYGFHAGNVMALIVYPYLLCKYVKKENKTPRFKFIVSLNDWEQDELDGPNPREYPFNIYPKHTSIYFLQDEKKCCKRSLDHWSPIIKKNIESLKKYFPDLEFTFVRNSELINYDFSRNLLKRTIQNPLEQFEILRSNSNKKTLPEPIQYAGAICPKCHSAHGDTHIGEDDSISWKCNACKYEGNAPMNDFQYWWYHKPMLIARLNVFKIDLTISGGDHYSEGDFNIRREFINKFSPETKEPRMLFTPIVIALDGQKMSKSRHNAEFALIEKLISKADNNFDAEILIDEELILRNIDEKDYSFDI